MTRNAAAPTHKYNIPPLLFVESLQPPKVTLELLEVLKTHITQRKRARAMLTSEWNFHDLRRRP